MTKRKLAAQQEKFVNNLLAGMHQDEAYIKAGYKAKGAAARANASRMLTNANIQEVLEERRKKAADKAEISQQRILAEEKRLAFFNPKKLVDKDGTLLSLHKLNDDIARAIAGFEVIKQADGSLKYKYRFSDKGKSLERISRHLGMYNDKLNLGFTAETLNAIIGALPDEYARAVREALGKLVSYRRG